MNQRRKAYPSRKTVFSAMSWAKWLSGQPGAMPSPDERTVQPREVDEFRHRVIIGRPREG